MAKSVSRPSAIIIFGPNGAGKTTFYEKVLKDDPFFKKVDFINQDIEAARLAGEDGDVNKVMRPAGCNIIHSLTDKLEKHESFIFETTGAGRTHINLIEKANEYGFRVVSIFIGLSAPELSHLRVQGRVQNGGHNVPAEDIERRFPRIMENFPEMLKFSDYSVAFDNSGKTPFELIFMMDQRSLFIFHKYPEWLDKALKSRKTRKDMIHITKEAFSSMKPEKVKAMTQRIFSRIDSAANDF